MSQEKYFSSYINDFYILCLIHILQANLYFVPYILCIMPIAFVPYIYYNTSIKWNTENKKAARHQAHAATNQKRKVAPL